MKKEPRSVASKVYQLLLENDKVGVLRMFKRGGTAKMHYHTDHLFMVSRVVDCSFCPKAKQEWNLNQIRQFL